MCFPVRLVSYILLIHLNPFGGQPHTFYMCPTCFQKCKSASGLIQHRNSEHRDFTSESADDTQKNVSSFNFHPLLTCELTPAVHWNLLPILNWNNYPLQCSRAVPSTSHTSCPTSDTWEWASYQPMGTIWLCTLPLCWSSKFNCQNRSSP